MHKKNKRMSDASSRKNSDLDEVIHKKDDDESDNSAIQMKNREHRATNAINQKQSTAEKPDKVTTN